MKYTFEKVELPSNMGKYGEITEHIKNMPYNEWNKVTGFENREDIKRFYSSIHSGKRCFANQLKKIDTKLKCKIPIEETFIYIKKIKIEK